MNKWFLGIASLLLVAVVSIYAFIPGTTSVARSVRINASEKNIYRVLADQSQWAKWLPEFNLTEDFAFKGVSYRITEKFLRVINVDIYMGNDTFPSNMTLTPIRSDSVEVLWTVTSERSLNPVKRLQRHYEALSHQNNLAEILNALNTFLSEERNIYGIDVEVTSVKDTLLITTKKAFPEPPDNNDVYTLVRGLQQYIVKQSGRETGFPMLNTRRTDNDHIEVMVAIPINKELPQSEVFKIKRMAPLKILRTEVQGGPYTIRNAFSQMENYVQDLRYQSPAIPFESLVTDRFVEQDTSKWITRIYYPVL
jgi:hypothetical protein